LLSKSIPKPISSPRTTSSRISCARRQKSRFWNTNDDVEALKAAAYPDGGTVADTLTNNVATIGENQQLRRMKQVSSL
jgi:translation elongation factor EF-Ts